MTLLFASITYEGLKGFQTLFIHLLNPVLATSVRTEKCDSKATTHSFNHDDEIDLSTYT